MRISRLPVLLVSAACVLFCLPTRAQSAPHGGGKAWTVRDLYRPGVVPGPAPRDYLWSPDGATATYLSADTQHGKPNDVVAVSAATGSATVLVQSARLAEIFGAKNDERDRDHRARYDEASYGWSPDSKHLLFDNSGTLWLYDLAAGTAVQAANTGAGSGDDPKFSPDGKLVSYIRNHNLHVMTLAGNRDRALTDTPEATLLNGEVDWVYDEELDVRSNYFWSPDSKRIAYLQTDEDTVPTYPITDWIPTHSTIYQQRYPQPGDPNPAVRVGVVAARGGKTTWMRVPLSAHNDYVPRFGWLDESHVWVEVLRRDQQHMELYFGDVKSGAVRKVLSQTDDKFFDDNYDIRFLPGQFVQTGWAGGHTHIYLYRYNAQDPMSADATEVRQITHGDWEVLKVVAVDPKLGVIDYTSNETDPREEMLWQVGLDGTGKKMLSTVHGVHRVSFGPDGAHYVDTVSSLMTPPVASICDLAGVCHEFWKSPALRGYNLVRPVMFTGKAADGVTTLYGEILLPPDMHQSASVPLIVNPYGGPHAQTVRDEYGQQGFLFDQLLMQHGFAVLHVDNRGMGNRSRAFAVAAYRNFGPVQLADQLAMVDQVLAKYPQLDAKRMGWWGWSWGGTFTLYAMTHSDRFVAGVDVAPVTNWRLYDSIYTERYLGLPADNQQVYHDDSVINSAAHLHGNLLMVHGTGDDNVHMQNSIQMIQQFVTADVPYRLLLYPRKTHAIAGQAARTQLFQSIVQQFVDNLHPQSAAD